jgi:hypothetical protein
MMRSAKNKTKKTPKHINKTAVNAARNRGKRHEEHPENQLNRFIAKFNPKNQKLIRQVRKALQKRFPTANELAWDNYNFFVIGYSATERPSDSIGAIAAGANGVGFSFYRGSELTDPKNILLGKGVQNRFVRVPEVGVLESAEVRALLDEAEERLRVPMRESGRGRVIVRSVSAKQRPRR